MCSKKILILTLCAFTTSSLMHANQPKKIERKPELIQSYQESFDKIDKYLGYLIKDVNRDPLLKGGSANAYEKRFLEMKALLASIEKAFNLDE